jgi:hypothetical protein
VFFRCPAAGDDGFQKNGFLAFDEWHKVGVAFDQNNRNFLAWITLLIWVVVNINFIANLYVENNLLERNAPLRFEKSVFLAVPSIDFHVVSEIRLC